MKGPKRGLTKFCNAPKRASLLFFKSVLGFLKLSNNNRIMSRGKPAPAS
uniref:Uncharacterized protein n=1 Tax=Setaria viridis TaxID=4556 RepID=A0A4U6U6C6_SETVI|nr:hypothetical protein SEVIR_6G124454v2 [Setaria viridis]